MLARIAPHLPAQVPVPEFLGRPEDDYPWPFVGGALIDGGEVADTDLGERQRRDMAAPVAAFLRALHAIDQRSPPACSRSIQWGARTWP